MDERRAWIHDDLRGVLEGELLFEPLGRSVYAHDASLAEVEPVGVVIPRTEADLVHTVRYAAENGLAVHPRGAGTGTTGGALGGGLVVDFSRHFRRIVEVQPDRVVVQPGVVLDELNAELAPLGRRLGPDPLGSEVGTVGGLVALDAGGPCALRYGTAGDHVEELRVVFANGDVDTLGFEYWPPYESEPADFKGLVVRKLGALVRRNLDLLMRRAPRSPRPHAGYALARAASGVGLHLPRLVAGSEGSLALVTEITLRTVPIPPAQAAALLPFARIADAAAAATDCLDASPTACELYDWRSIRLAREASAVFREWIPESAEAVLVVLFEGADPEEVLGRAGTTALRLSRGGKLVSNAVVTPRRVECERMLHLRREVEPLLMRAGGRARPVNGLDGVAVPPENLPEMIQRLQAIFRAHDINWILDAHAGLGQLRPRPFLDLSDPDDLARLDPIAAEVYEAALDLGGAVSGEGGGGLERARFLRRQFGELLPVFREIKDAFDPLNLLNPGQVVSDDTRPIPRQLRIPSRRPADDAEPPTGVSPFLPVLRWGDRGPAETASSCTSCGLCRTLEPTLRMCPSFRASRKETAAPRAQANLVRQVASGAVDPKLWGSEEFRDAAGACVHCNLCRTECPSGVDVSGLMIEAKAAYVENHGLSPGDWAVSRVEFWSRLASRIPILTNAVLGSRSARWFLERLFGLSRLRRLPRVHRTPFTKRAARLGLTRPRPQEAGPRVVYFVDVFANYYDQELAAAVVDVLRRAGVNVYVPTGQRDSGMPALVVGDVEHARDLALANLRVLGNAVRDGYTVVCSEPTAALMLRQEYLKLTDDLDAALVAENTREVGQYLAGLAERGQLPTPDHPLHARVGYHQPCHLRALGAGTPGLDLLRLIPELNVEFIDRGCSGMAGTYGLRAEHFRTSLRAGRGLLRRLRDGDLEVGSTECSACRMQMEQGSPKRTLHPVKLLSLAYGLNPSLRQGLRSLKPRYGVL